MRFEARVKFVSGREKRYNRKTGNYETTGGRVEYRLADVTDVGLEREQLLYGTVGIDAITVRLKSPVTADFDFLEIDGKRYEPKSVKTYRNRQTIEAVKAQ